MATTRNPDFSGDASPNERHLSSIGLATSRPGTAANFSRPGTAKNNNQT